MEDTIDFSVQYISDIHLEFQNNSNYLLNNPLQVCSEILIIAGDCIVITGDYQQHPFFKWCSNNYKETYIVFGNHEFYGGFDVNKTCEPTELFIYDNVRFINNKSIILNETELFFTTLWTRLDDDKKQEIESQFNDFHLIKCNDKKFTANDYNDMFNCCSKWLDNALSKSQRKRKIVVTHHCPTFQLVKKQYQGHPLTSFVYVNVEDIMIKNNVNVWIYGHSHTNFKDSKINDTIVVSNQFGYIQNGISEGYCNYKTYPENKSCLLV
ncbi:Calcineurin-like phosphoesterase domain-containing protein [Entamoeba marina]